MRILLLLVGLLTAWALAAMGWYAWGHPSMDSFCSGLPEDSDPASVLARAQALGVPAADLTKEAGRVIVWNHAAPYFRTACVVDFKNGKLSGRRVKGTD